MLICRGVLIFSACNFLSFDGASPYASVANIPGGAPTAFSIEVWIRFHGTAGYQAIWSDSVSEAGAVQLALVNSQIVFTVAGGASAAFPWLPTTGQWHFIVVAYVSGNYVMAYVDGGLVGSSSATLQAVPFDGAFLGSQSINFALGQYLAADIAGLRIWSVEQDGLDSCPLGNEPALLLYYQMNDCGSTIVDHVSTIYPSNAKIFGAANWGSDPYLPTACFNNAKHSTTPSPSACLNPNAARLDGLAKYVAVPKLSLSSSGGMGLFTLEVNIYFRSVEFAVIWSDNGPSGNGSVQVYVENGGFRFDIMGLPPNHWFWQPLAYQWYTITMVYNSAVGFSLYLNRILVQAIPISQSTVVTPFTGSTIGASLNSSFQYTGFANADIGDIQLWNVDTKGQNLCPTGSEPELQLFYTFSQCSNVAIDSSLRGNNGTLQYSALITLPINTYCNVAGANNSC